MLKQRAFRSFAAALVALVVGLNCQAAFAQEAPESELKAAMLRLKSDAVGEGYNIAPLPSAFDEQTGTQQQGVQQRTPLTPGQKMTRAFRRAFLAPEGYIQTGISAVITEATEEDLPHKDTDDRVADGASRFAIKFGTRATRVLLGAGVFPIIFKQDPRYERSESKNIARRALHAASRVFVTRGDNGSLQPNYSRWAGNFSASALANIWEQSTPNRDRIGTDATIRRFGSLFITDAVGLIVLNEFLPDVISKFKKK